MGFRKDEFLGIVCMICFEFGRTSYKVGSLFAPRQGTAATYSCRSSATPYTKGLLKIANHPMSLMDAGILLRNNEFTNNSMTSTSKGIHHCR
jgi:hypothetical protein